MRSLLFLFSVLITLTSPVPAWCQSNPDNSTYNLAVDFLHSETRSVSIPLGKGDGMTADLFFALLDETGRVIVEVNPFEILNNRFWSGPLSVEEFSRVRIGTPAVRVTLSPDEALRLKERYRARAAALKKAITDRRRKRLEADLAELDDEVLNLSNRRKMIRRDSRELQRRLAGKRSGLSLRLAGKDAEMKDDRDSLRELQDERIGLFDERKRLEEMSFPRKARIERLNAKIAALNDDIGQLRGRILELREEKRKATDEADRRGISRIKGELEDLAGEDARVREDLADLRTKRAGIIRELERLKGGD